MKKILAIFLALVMILSVALVACSKDKATTGGNSDDAEDDDIFVQNSKDKETSDTDKDDKKTGGWEAAAYPIYCMATGLNVRSSDSTSSDKLGTLKIGDKLDATERNDDWYKVTYNGVIAYVARDYVTASANEATFTDLGEAKTMHVVDAKKDLQVVLRNDPVISDDTIGMYFKGTDTGVLTQIGSNADGSWYKVSYDPDGVGEKAAVEYYLSVGKSARELFGISSSAGGYS